jgi:hypothetical protein
MIAELFLIVVLLCFIAFGVYVIVLDVQKSRPGGGVTLTPTPGAPAASKEVAAAAAVSPSKETGRSVSRSAHLLFLC